MVVTTGFVGCQNDVGRYQWKANNQAQLILDTKTGDAYRLDGKNEINQLHKKNNEPMEWELFIEK